MRSLALRAAILALAAASAGCASRRERLLAFEEGRESAFFREQSALARAAATEGSVEEHGR